MPPESRAIKHAGIHGRRPPHREAPVPLQHSILWTPRGAAEGEITATHPTGSYPLFFEHDALAGVNRHLDRAEREPRFGFLLGHLYRDPESGVEFAVADTAVAAREVLLEEASGAYLIRAWSEAQAVFSGHTGLLLGWYHSHYRLGLAPSEADLDTSARYFGAPWQLSVIVVPDRARPLGGVFRHLAADGTKRAHSRPVTFYEILPAPHGGDIDGAESAVAWANYESRAPILPVARASEEIQEPAGAESIEKAGPRNKAMSRKKKQAEVGDEAAPVPGPDEPAPESTAVADEVAPSPPREPPPPPSASPEERRRARPEPRVTLWQQAEPPAAEPPAGERPAGERQRDVAMPTDGPARGDRPAGVPLVLPGEKAETGLLPPRSRRIAWPVVAVAVFALAATLYFLMPDTPTPPSSTRPDAPASGASGTAASPELRGLLEEVDALGVAAERYAERANDFDAGRIGCDLLATGYVTADEAYVRVAAAFGELPSQANPRATAAYERAGEEMAEVNSHFDQSGCPRP